jgi:protein SCO1/2
VSTRRLASTSLAIALLAAAAHTAATAGAGAAGVAEPGRPGYAGSADFVQHLGQSVPADLPFRDERGNAVRLGSYLGSAPIGLIFSYYRCTNLCPMQIRNFAQRMALTSGGAADAQVIVVSIDPLDTPALADRAKHKFLDDLLPAAQAARWHFLSGAPADIARLAQSLGFSYGYDAATRQYAHPAGFALINADGRIARYFFGFGYTPADLGQAFDEAAAQRIASPIARLLLVCFHYDLATGRYSDLVIAVLRAVSAIMLLGGALALGWTLLRRARATEA